MPGSLLHQVSTIFSYVLPFFLSNQQNVMNMPLVVMDIVKQIYDEQTLWAVHADHE